MLPETLSRARNSLDCRSLPSSGKPRADVPLKTLKTSGLCKLCQTSETAIECNSF